MTPKHTPGPWGTRDGHIYQEESGVTLALVTYYDKEIPHKKADAQLIAAAPDLLQAVKDALETIGELRAELDRDQPRMDIERRLEQIIYDIEETK